MSATSSVSGLAEIADDDWDFVKLGLLRRAPAAFASNDLVAGAVRAHDDRLDHAAHTPDRRGELLQRFFAEDGDAAAVMRAMTDATGDDLDARRLRVSPSVSGLLFARGLRQAARMRATSRARRATTDGRIVAHAATAGFGLWAGGRSISGQAPYRLPIRRSDNHRSRREPHSWALPKGGRCGE